MNISHVMPVVSPEKFFNTKYLYHEEAKRGHKVNFITWNPQQTYRILSVNERLKVYLLPGPNISFLRNIINPLIPDLGACIRASKVDVIHAHQLFKLTTLSSAIVSKKLDVPLIVTMHGVIAPEGFLLEGAQQIYYYTLGKMICKIASKIRCLTQRDALDMFRFGCPREKIVIIPNGIDTEKFKPENQGLPNTIFWGGRFVSGKGLEYLIKALKIIEKKHHNFRLIMAGDGYLFHKIHNLVDDYGLSKNVIFEGRVPHNEIPKFLNSASIYVLPSIREGMPYALLEAMACGRPVVASNIPGINDVITNGENGLLVPPCDPNALANAILRLIEDHALRRKLRRNARKLMVEKYSWDIIAGRTEKVYYEMAEEANRV